MKKHIVRISFVAAASVLTGCAANYKPIEGRPTTELRFATQTIMPTDLSSLSTIIHDKCPKVEMKRLLNAKEISNQFKSIYIEAGQPFLVRAEHVSPYLMSQCNVTATFTPEKGYTYNLKSTLTAKNCTLEMMRYKGNLLSFEPTFKIVQNFPDDELCKAFK